MTTIRRISTARDYDILPTALGEALVAGDLEQVKSFINTKGNNPELSNLYKDPKIAVGLWQCMDHNNAEMTRLILRGCGKEPSEFELGCGWRNICERLFLLCVEDKGLDLVRLILTEFKELLSQRIIKRGFDMVCDHKNIVMINLFIDTCDYVLVQPTEARPNISRLHMYSYELYPVKGSNYVQKFNSACECGNYEVVQLLLTRCFDYLQFGDGFTLNINRVIKNPDIVELLIATYGERLTDQYPILLGPVECEDN